MAREAAHADGFAVAGLEQDLHETPPSWVRLKITVRRYAGKSRNNGSSTSEKPNRLFQQGSPGRRAQYLLR
ncbi:hypothetical protein PSAB6_440022 [Paraburkholderia sabiae]|nr:hypothetical protein PSAB6_440022 [Paraburkholderia sabiae]